MKWFLKTPTNFREWSEFNPTGYPHLDPVKVSVLNDGKSLYILDQKGCFWVITVRNDNNPYMRPYELKVIYKTGEYHIVFDTLDKIQEAAPKLQTIIYNENILNSLENLG